MRVSTRKKKRLKMLWNDLNFSVIGFKQVSLFSEKGNAILAKEAVGDRQEARQAAAKSDQQKQRKTKGLGQGERKIKRREICERNWVREEDKHLWGHFQSNECPPCHYFFRVGKSEKIFLNLLYRGNNLHLMKVTSVKCIILWYLTIYGIMWLPPPFQGTE